MDGLDHLGVTPDELGQPPGRDHAAAHAEFLPDRAHDALDGERDTIDCGDGDDSVIGDIANLTAGAKVVGGDDRLFGGSGNDRIIGGLGNDRLTGGTGSDAFHFDAALDSALNRDVIRDFSAADDTILIYSSVFSSLGQAPGTLGATAFFASVEQAADPRLRGKPIAVGGERRGIIASASYEARRLGIYTPMPTLLARRLCPRQLRLLLAAKAAASGGT